MHSKHCHIHRHRVTDGLCNQRHPDYVIHCDRDKGHEGNHRGLHTSGVYALTWHTKTEVSWDS